MAEPRVGVYICDCGTNIAGVVDMDEVVEFSKRLPNVVLAKEYKYVCSEPGQAMIKKDIKEKNLDRVVVAACSPRMHESTFRRVVKESGLNPYLLEIANIREQCSWTHTHDPKNATEKTKKLLASAVAKAALNEPLESREVKVEPTALVIGGGIAGIQASLDLADNGFKVYLVEKSPSIGGHMAQLDKTFPTLDCSACILTPKMTDVLHHPNITLLTNSEVQSVDGYIGNFKVKILKKPRYVIEDKCTACDDCVAVCPVEIPSEFDVGLSWRKAIYIQFPQAVPTVYTIDEKNCLNKEGMAPLACDECKKACEAEAIDYDMQPEILDLDIGAIVVATGFDLFDPTSLQQYGYGFYSNVITNLEFERLINAGGPTGGLLVRPSDRKVPKRIAFIQCIGSRDENSNLYCSRICCMASLKHAHQVKEKNPDTEVYMLYMDIRAFGKGYEEFYERVQSEGLRLIRGRAAEIIEEPETKNLRLRFEDTLLGKLMEIEVDMVVLAAGLVQRSDSTKIQQMLKIPYSPDNFYLEAHPKLRPSETVVEGIYICGSAQGPKDIPDTVAQASGAAAKAAAILSKEKLEIEGAIAIVEEDLCSGCRICEAVCEYSAIEMSEDEEGKLRPSVLEALCKGCGVCGSACPSGAISMGHFTDMQILSQLRAALKEVEVKE